MRTWTGWLVTIVLAAAAHTALAQRGPGDREALRQQIAARYDIVPLAGGIALRPRSPIRDVRLIEIADGSILVNGTAVTGRELRDRVGSDADAMLRLSYLSPDELGALARPAGDGPAADETREPAAAQPPPSEPLERAGPAQTTPPAAARPRRSSGDRVRILGDVQVAEDEEITGQVVAVLGSVKVDGVVGDQVVAVLGSVELGPRAVVRGDVVSVGGRVRRAAGAQTRGGVTEVAFADPEFRIRAAPWLDGWGPFVPFVSFGAVPRLVGSGFRLLLLLLLAGIALLVARRSVEASAQRVADNPVKVTVIGLIAEILILPALVLTAIVMAISIIGIPLLVLIPVVVLVLMLMALVGFTGTAAAVGQSLQRRLALGSSTTFVSISLGVLVILSPLLIGRLLAIAGWPVTPFSALFIGAGFVVELLAWAGGFGAVLTNAFSRWQAGRPLRTQAGPPPVVP
jgi:hypothetical protein